LKALLTELDLTLDIETQLADERLDLRLSRQKPDRLWRSPTQTNCRSANG